MNAELTRTPSSLRRLSASDTDDYRELRLEGLLRNPEAFGASWEDEVSQPLDWFAERLKNNIVFGASLPTGPALVGIVGLFVPLAPKIRHKGKLWGMFVRPEAQGEGLGAALLARVLQHAAQIVEEVQLTVVASNAAAICLYARTGFEQYGLERRALKVGDDYHDELFMTLPMTRHG